MIGQRMQDSTVTVTNWEVISGTKGPYLLSMDDSNGSTTILMLAVEPTAIPEVALLNLKSLNRKKQPIPLPNTRKVRRIPAKPACKKTDKWILEPTEKANTGSA